MRIGIDCRPLGGASGRRGVGTYLRGLVGAVLEERGEEEILLYHQAGVDLPPAWIEKEGVEPIPLTRPRRAVTLWDQVAWPRTLSRDSVDLFHSAFWTLPLLAPPRVALVQTIHDLTPVRCRGSVSMKNEMIFRANFACARRARRVIVPSRATLNDAVSYARIRSDRIRVVPEGVAVDPDMLAQGEERLQDLRGRFGIEGRYLLHTGGQDPVKNLEGAVEAIGILAGHGFDGPLVVTGEPGRVTAAMRRRAGASGEKRLIFTGFVPRADLIALYRGAAVLLYPSRNEGFGLPVLEAMACGTPVVAARAGSLPEVGGSACLYADPDDVAALAAAAASILEDDALSRRLSEAGKERSAAYTWEEAARGTLRVYREAASP